jgi:iron-sulfur cluster assembly accessory protein
MPLVITDKAAAKLESIRNGRSGYPRIEILAGGCNGFEKSFGWTEEPAADDILFDTSHGKIVLDTVSLDMLENAIVDYRVDLQGSYFHINIPEATSTCGCGTSFSL